MDEPTGAVPQRAASVTAESEGPAVETARPRSPSLMDRLDTFFSDFRRSRSKSATANNATSGAQASQLAAAPVVVESACDASAPTTENSDTVGTAAATTSSSVDATAAGERDSVAGDGQQGSERAASPPTNCAAAEPVPHVETAPSLSTPTGDAPPAHDASRFPEQETSQSDAGSVSPLRTSASVEPSSTRPRRMSLSESFTQFARKHGIYYSPALSQGVAAVFHDASAATVATSALPNTPDSQPHGCQQNNWSRTELVEWLRRSKPGELSLVQLAASSHRSDIPRLVHEEGLRALDDVRWPLLEGLLATFVWRQQRWENRVTSAVVVVGGTAVALIPAVDSVPSFVIEDSASPSKPPSAAIRSDAAMHVHMTHRILDFFQSYDSERVPSMDKIHEVVHCGVPERMLFSYLKARYGLPDTSSSSHVISGGVAENADPLVAVVDLVPVDAGGSTPQAATRSLQPPEQPKQEAEGASPDFGLASPSADHVLRDATSTLAHIHDALDMSHWNPEWAAAVRRMLPSGVELLSGTWNSQSSKPGLANPRTVFPKSQYEQQLFTFFGCTLALHHDSMEARFLPFPTRARRRSSSADASENGVGRQAADDDDDCAVATRGTTEVGGLVTFPWLQSAALLQRLNGATAATASGSSVTSSSSLPPPGSVAPAPSPSPPFRESHRGFHYALETLDKHLRERREKAAQHRRRGPPASRTADCPAPLSDEWMCDEIASSILRATLSWSSATGTGGANQASSTNANCSSNPCGQSRVAQHDYFVSDPEAIDEAGGAAIMMHFEDHWGVEDADLRDIQSPVELQLQHLPRGF